MVISILCGGSGTRLWPLSRKLMPKQFAKLIGQDSIFKMTLERNQEILQSNDTLQIITNEQHYFLALDIAQSLDITIHSFILESLAKNTAAALTISALLVAKQNPNEVILTLPSDHIIHDNNAYKDCVYNACEIAKNGNIVTFGITPNSPHTGYGYIQASPSDTKSHEVIAFHEKPDINNAKIYLEKGGYFWNSGMFCYQASVLLHEMQTYAPDIYQACNILLESSLQHSHNDFIRLDRQLSAELPDKSIDYALMEKTKKLRMIEANFTWNDVGSFESLCEELPKDSNNNIMEQSCIAMQSHNNLIMSDKMVATLGIDDCVIVDTKDALLVAKKGYTQDIKKIVSELESRQSPLIEIHNQAFRPWGSYTILQESLTYKLKSIVVKPKHRLSLQKHYHRNEHWIVVSGSAIVQIEDKEIFLSPNQSTYIPMGHAHRLTNPGTIDLVMIEVQVGEYLGEDDIVRLDDDYARS